MTLHIVKAQVDKTSSRLNELYLRPGPTLLYQTLNNVGPVQADVEICDDTETSQILNNGTNIVQRSTLGGGLRRKYFLLRPCPHLVAVMGQPFTIYLENITRLLHAALPNSPHHV